MCAARLSADEVQHVRRQLDRCRRAAHISVPWQRHLETRHGAHYCFALGSDFCTAREARVYASRLQRAIGDDDMSATLFVAVPVDGSCWRVALSEIGLAYLMSHE